MIVEAVVIAVVSAGAGYYVAGKVTKTAIEAELKAIEAKAEAEGRILVADVKALIAKIRAKIGTIKL